MSDNFKTNTLDNQFLTYNDEITELFIYHPHCFKDITARLGSLSTDFERFIPWKVVDDKTKESD